MFRTEHEYVVDTLRIVQAEKNYSIQKNDYISLQVYSNSGERIIDPDFELSKAKDQKAQEPIRYLVKVDGKVDLPMIGNTYLAGFTLYQADSILSVAYTKFYKNPYVVTRLLSKRVIVFGPSPATTSAYAGVAVTGKVIPLENENMNLVEVLALFGGIGDHAKAYNIKLIRGDLKNPDVSIIDLSTIEGMRKANLAIHPNDIIYIEPTRKYLIESLRDIAPIMSLISSLLLTAVVLFKK
jgi:polysaccharide export outer membrane protein